MRKPLAIFLALIFTTSQTALALPLPQETDVPENSSLPAVAYEENRPASSAPGSFLQSDSINFLIQADTALQPVSGEAALNQETLISPPLSLTVTKTKTDKLGRVTYAEGEIRDDEGALVSKFIRDSVRYAGSTSQLLSYRERFTYADRSVYTGTFTAGQYILKGSITGPLGKQSVARYFSFDENTQFLFDRERTETQSFNGVVIAGAGEKRKEWDYDVVRYYETRDKPGRITGFEEYVYDEESSALIYKTKRTSVKYDKTGVLTNYSEQLIFPDKTVFTGAWKSGHYRLTGKTANAPLGTQAVERHFDFSADSQFFFDDRKSTLIIDQKIISGFYETRIEGEFEIRRYKETYDSQGRLTGFEEYVYDAGTKVFLYKTLRYSMRYDKNGNLALYAEQFIFPDKNILRGSWTQGHYRLKGTTKSVPTAKQTLDRHFDFDADGQLFMDLTRGDVQTIGNQIVTGLYETRATGEFEIRRYLESRNSLGQATAYEEYVYRNGIYQYKIIRRSIKYDRTTGALLSYADTLYFPTGRTLKMSYDARNQFLVNGSPDPSVSIRNLKIPSVTVVDEVFYRADEKLFYVYGNQFFRFDQNGTVFHEETYPPTGTIAINQNAEWTVSRTVTLNLTASDDASGIDGMRFSTDNGTTWTAWENFSASKTLTLPAGDGLKTVLYEIRDGAGKTAQFSDTIKLDTVLPVLTPFSLPASGTTDIPYFVIPVNVTDTNAVNPVEYVTVNLTPGSNAVPVTVADKAGNQRTITVNLEYVPADEGLTAQEKAWRQQWIQENAKYFLAGQGVHAATGFPVDLIGPNKPGGMDWTQPTSIGFYLDFLVNVITKRITLTNLSQGAAIAAAEKTLTSLLDVQNRFGWNGFIPWLRLDGTLRPDRSEVALIDNANLSHHLAVFISALEKSNLDKTEAASLSQKAKTFLDNQAPAYAAFTDASSGVFRASYNTATGQFDGYADRFGNEVRATIPFLIEYFNLPDSLWNNLMRSVTSYPTQEGRTVETFSAYDGGAFQYFWPLLVSPEESLGGIEGALKNAFLIFNDWMERAGVAGFPSAASLPEGGYDPYLGIDFLKETALAVRGNYASVYALASAYRLDPSLVLQALKSIETALPGLKGSLGFYDSARQDGAVSRNYYAIDQGSFLLGLLGKGADDFKSFMEKRGLWSGYVSHYDALNLSVTKVTDTLPEPPLTQSEIQTRTPDTVNFYDGRYDYDGIQSGLTASEITDGIYRYHKLAASGWVGGFVNPVFNRNAYDYVILEARSVAGGTNTVRFELKNGGAYLLDRSLSFTGTDWHTFQFFFPKDTAAINFIAFSNASGDFEVRNLRFSDTPLFAGDFPPAVQLVSPSVTNDADYALVYTLNGTEYRETVALNEGANSFQRTFVNTFGEKVTHAFSIQRQVPGPEVILLTEIPEATTSPLLRVEYTVAGVEKRTFFDLNPGQNHFEIREKDASNHETIVPIQIRYDELAVPQASSKVYTSAGDRRLFVQERKFDGSLAPAQAFTAKGVNWSPHRPGVSESNLHLEFAANYQRDIPLMAKMGINVVRVYHDFGTGPQAFQILDMFYRYGIKVIVEVDSPRQGVVADLANIQAVVNAYKNHPAILMWSIGNEWDLNRYYGTFASLQAAAAFTEQAAQLIKSIDSNHAVTTVIADPHIPGIHPLSEEAFPFATGPYTTEEIVNTLVPSVDVWGLNLYRGSSFQDVFLQWKSISNKPMFIGEFGADSYDHRIVSANQTMQAEVNRGMWDELYFDLSAERTQGAAVGGLLFEWNDEWWKNGSPSSQTITSEANGGQPDGYNDEEWFGLVDINRNPKPIYSDLQNRFWDGAEAVELNASPVIEVVSQNAAHGADIRLNGKTVFSRSGGGGGGRGINVAVLDTSNGIRMLDVRNFDTWYSKNGFGSFHFNFEDFANYINALPDGAVIALAVGDEGGFTNTSNVKWPDVYVDMGIAAIESLGSQRVRDIGWQDGWAMIAIKGQGVLAEVISQNGSTISTQAEIAITLNPDSGRR